MNFLHARMFITNNARYLKSSFLSANRVRDGADEVVPMTLFDREPLECGSKLRLQHLVTKKFLHSHHFSSPLSRNQEISAFGNKGVLPGGGCARRGGGAKVNKAW